VLVGVWVAVGVLERVEVGVAVAVGVEVGVMGPGLAVIVGLSDTMAGSARTVPSGGRSGVVGVEVKVGTMPNGSDGVVTASGVGQAKADDGGSLSAMMEVGLIKPELGGTA